MAELFDTNYVREGDFDPAIYHTPAVPVLIELVRPRLDRELDTHPSMTFCLLQDRNGFNPVHNTRCSHPRRANDRQWNMRHSRMQRLFEDAVSLATVRNIRPVIVKSYLRDMGDALEDNMEFASPIFVKGRHWGAACMAYRLDDAQPRAGSVLAAADVARRSI